MKIGMLSFEPWRDRISVHIGDFTPSLFVEGHDAGVYISGIVTESEPGVFGFAVLLSGVGIGISMRFRPGPWTPGEE